MGIFIAVFAISFALMSFTSGRIITGIYKHILDMAADQPIRKKNQIKIVYLVESDRVLGITEIGV